MKKLSKSKRNHRSKTTQVEKIHKCNFEGCSRDFSSKYRLNVHLLNHVKFMI